jgi:hypothetical protein
MTMMMVLMPMMVLVPILVVAIRGTGRRAAQTECGPTYQQRAS